MFLGRLKMDDDEMSEFEQVVSEMSAVDWVQLFERNSKETRMFSKRAFSHDENTGSYQYTKLGFNLVRFHDDTQRVTERTRNIENCDA